MSYVDSAAGIPLAKLLAEATAAGATFRVHGYAVQVHGVGGMPKPLRAALRARCYELWEHLGGNAFDRPSLDLLAKLGVRLVIPSTEAKALAALTQIERDSDANRPADLQRPGWVGFDIETAALPGVETRPTVKLRRDGLPVKEQPKFRGKAALDPHTSSIRLVQLYGGGETCVILDTSRLSLDLLLPLIGRRTLVIHNAPFELRFFADRGVALPFYECTQQAAGLLLGVRRRSLEAVAGAYLGIDVPKELQTSDWSAPELTPGQYAYAALDSIVAFRLWPRLRQELLMKQRGEAYTLQRDVAVPVVRMMARGLRVDPEVHAEQLAGWERQLSDQRHQFAEETKRPVPADDTELRKYLVELLPADVIAAWPVTAKKRWLSVANKDLRRQDALVPIRALLSISATEKLLTNFGDRLLDKVSARTGRLHSDYNIASAKTGRFSSSNPNAQQIPKNKAAGFRACFIPATGNVFVVADYRMMELFAAAWVSGDQAMLHDLASGIDMHRRLAAEMLSIPESEVTDRQRDGAKCIVFGILYGAGPAGLAKSAWNSYGIDMDIETARNARTLFLRRYHVFADWMITNHSRCTQQGFIPIGRLGRVIEAAWEIGSVKASGRFHRGGWDYGDEDDGDFDDEELLNEYAAAQETCYQQIDSPLRYTLCNNAPIQGSCADCAMLALLLVDDALRDIGITGGPVLFVHDELVIEVSADQAERARAILISCMAEAFGTTFPGAPLDNIVECDIRLSWQKPPKATA
jgi:DNA polymerase I-like protein with 3'-5' exonuclease and polymerase domains